MEKYRLDISEIKNKEGTWDSVLCKIFNGDKFIAEYIRHYPAFANQTFAAFKAADGNDYALFSANHELVSLMRLSDGIDIQTQESKTQMFTFCPVEIFVPADKLIGFTLGCVWGDDGSWKLNIIDLRDAHNGNIWYLGKKLTREWLYEEWVFPLKLSDIEFDDESPFPEWVSVPVIMRLPVQ